ncbi:PREDICTED: uncharacterized protein K02A2.6-like [Wasmannia auropunctata]|uniref:uncharacterized protein K02A2.6-like n=1 Tax=Wasmannia auropunctata TaxID=64793 RepID=UPI0005EE71F5|nr:PREDICTED: uncharacterized protein K02A2.6-like [Wasmannia auropunctata]
MPFKLVPLVDKEIEDLEAAGILIKVNNSEWATPIVPVLKKEGKVRICGDYSVTVNPNLIVDNHPLPTIDELFATMAGGTTFSKIDLKQAYLQLEVREEDQQFLTLNTHRGLYKPTRLMYGLASAPAIWQREIENILKDIPGVTVFLDDIKITDSHGIHKDKKKIEAIEHMPIPKNVSEVRAFIGFVTCEYDVVDAFQIDTIQSLPVTFERLVTATKQDTHLRQILEALQSGKKTNKKYKSRTDEIEYSVQQGIILHGHRVVIPKVLQGRILQELHSAHFGIVKMKMLARSRVWWSGIDHDIEEITKNCAERNANKNNPPKIKHNWESATFPFERVHVDFAGPFKGHNFLILVDAYIKWPEVHVVNNITAETTIKKCREIFSRFSTSEFQKFLQQNGIRHKLTAPYNPATNGQAERFVQTLKKSLLSMETQNKDLDVVLQHLLMQYRVTPHCTTQTSPAKLMFDREIRCALDIMKPTKDSNNTAQIHGDKKYREIKEGERVSCRNYLQGDKWNFGKIKKRVGKLHYLIHLDDGRIWKRHINQIRLIGKCTPQRTSMGERNNSKYANYNSEGENREVLQQPQEIVVERPMNIPQLRRSERTRAPPQRYGDYVTH